MARVVVSFLDVEAADAASHPSRRRGKMRKLLMVVVVAVLPFAARAQLQLGARIGYGLAMGDMGGDVGEPLAMSDFQSSQIPLQLDVLYSVNVSLAVGAYFSYGFGSVGDGMDEDCRAFGIDCTASTMRLGAQVQYAFSPGKQWSPWAGAGLGYEWNTVDAESDEFTFKGWEYLNLQGGADYKLNERFSAGPYVMLAIGQYDEAELFGESGDVPEKAMHSWLSFGIRGKFDL
jgi:hypothetical protein